MHYTYCRLISNPVNPEMSFGPGILIRVNRMIEKTYRVWGIAHRTDSPTAAPPSGNGSTGLALGGVGHELINVRNSRHEIRFESRTRIG